MMISKIDALVIIDPERDFVYPDGALFVKGFNLDPSVEDCISNIVQLVTSLSVMLLSHEIYTLLSISSIPYSQRTVFWEQREPTLSIL